MLRLMGFKDTGDTNTLKKRFAQLLSNDPLRSESYTRCFDRHCLDNGRRSEPAVELLLSLFEQAPIRTT